MSVTIRVECYSGYTYAQEPRAIEWRGRRYEVRRVIKRWRTPSGPAFRVEVAALNSQFSDDKSGVSGLFDLHYLEAEDEWTMSAHS